MTKTSAGTTPKISPADAVKAKLNDPSFAGRLEEAVVDERSPEEIAADEPNTVDIDEADLDAADAQEEGGEDPRKQPEVIDLSEDPVSEDPAITAARKEAFRRAAEFEAKRDADRERKKALLSGAVIPATIPAEQIGTTSGIPDIFYQYGTALPQTTPDEHVICGYGSIKLRVGDFRRLIGLPSRV